MRREEVECYHLRRFGFEYDDDPDVVDQLRFRSNIQVILSGRTSVIQQFKKLENPQSSCRIDYGLVRGLSKEEVEKLTAVRRGRLDRPRGSVGKSSAVHAIMIHLRVEHLRRSFRGRACRI